MITSTRGAGGATLQLRIITTTRLTLQLRITRTTCASLQVGMIGMIGYAVVRVMVVRVMMDGAVGSSWRVGVVVWVSGVGLIVRVIPVVGVISSPCPFDTGGSI